ncbi:hypothetical protein RRG08_047795 [Elysia crispata]|uniref:Uncharacterized protein n=1 Tax=Elysia crispata TaxID=231223 RepID=A0AAE0Y3C9_9GAST|nr:hypothetical protein RRG08_047795 [Elysia crispata]
MRTCQRGPTNEDLPERTCHSDSIIWGRKVQPGLTSDTQHATLLARQPQLTWEEATEDWFGGSSNRGGIIPRFPFLFPIWLLLDARVAPVLDVFVLTVEWHGQKHQAFVHEQLASTMLFVNSPQSESPATGSQGQRMCRLLMLGQPGY